MKLKNKKTGEIKDIDIRLLGTEPDMFVDSIAELNAEWEDYEESKEDGFDHIITLVEAYSNRDGERYPKEIVDKLKAWQRLKDKGFRFDGYGIIEGKIKFIVDLKKWEPEELYPILDLLFGVGDTDVTKMGDEE